MNYPRAAGAILVAAGMALSPVFSTAPAKAVPATVGQLTAASHGMAASHWTAGSPGTPQQAKALLRSRITRALKGSSAGHVRWRFDVSGLGPIEHSAAEQSHPASNEKLFTAETALQLLGPSYRFDTQILGTGKGVGHTLHGSLVVVGGGDPVLQSADLAFLARRVRKAGISKVTGGLVVDDARYQHRSSAPGWKPDFTPKYVGPIDAFAVNEDEVSSSPAYVQHTAVDNARLFRAALAKQHVTVKGSTRLGQEPTHFATVAAEKSNPLSVIVSQMLTVSDDFIAEMLLDELGSAEGSGGTRSAGVSVVRRETHTLGVTMGPVVDGSGLSYDDEESPDSLVAELDAIATSTSGAAVRADLPISCETGTLSDRMCGPATKGRVEAKTGTLEHDAVLSGYTTTKSGRTVTFSLMLSKVRNIGTAEEKIDAAVEAVARFDR